MIALPSDPNIDTVLSSADLTDAEVAALDTAAHEVVLTPFRRREDGAGVYDTTLTFLVKEMRSAGLDVGFLDPPGQRVFDVRKSAVADLIQIGISIPGTLVANSIWWQLERLLVRRFGSGNTSASVLEVTVIDPQAGQKLVIKGQPDDVTRAVTDLAAQNPPPSGGNPNPPPGAP